MKLDALLLNLLARELNGLAGCKVRKISQLGPEDFLLVLWSGVAGERRVLLSLQHDAVRLHQVEVDPAERPQAEVPGAFCMLLRKHLEGARLREVGTWGMERLVMFRFERSAEPLRILLLEATATSRNLLITDEEGRVLGDLRGQVRHLSPHAMALGPAPDGSSLSGAALVEAVRSDPARKLWRGIIAAAFGWNGVAAREIVAMAELDGEVEAGTLDDASTARLAVAWDAWLERFRGGPWEPGFYPQSGAWDPWPYQSLAGRERQPFASFSLLVEAASTGSWTQHVLASQRSALNERLSKALQKTLRKIAMHEQHREALESAPRLREYGDLLLAYAAQIPARSEKATLENFYADPPRPIEIPLDPALSAPANAQRYFHRYKKARRGQTALAEQLEKARRLTDWLEEMQLAVIAATSLAELEELRLLLRGEGFAPAESVEKSRKKTSVRRAGAAPSLRRFRILGFEVLVGRNPRENEEISLRLSHGDDLWFHARAVPGCHVLVRRASAAEIPEAVVVAAATLAAKNSKACASGKVAVDYTAARFLKKPPGTPMGLVTIRNEKTMVVRTDAEALGRLDEMLSPWAQ